MGNLEIASSKLRDDTRELLRRVVAGEEFTIAIDGRPIAVLHAVATRSRWMNGSELFRRLSDHQADPGMAEELTELAPDTTDQNPLS